MIVYFTVHSTVHFILRKNVTLKNASALCDDCDGDRAINWTKWNETVARASAASHICFFSFSLSLSFLSLCVSVHPHASEQMLSPDVIEIVTHSFSTIMHDTQMHMSMSKLKEDRDKAVPSLTEAQGGRERERDNIKCCLWLSHKSMLIIAFVVQVTRIQSRLPLTVHCQL